MWRVEVAPRVLKELRDLPLPVRERFDRLLAECENGLADPRRLPQFKRLHPRRDYGSFLLGLDHRAGVIILDDAQIICIVTVGSRENFYRRFPPK